MRALTGTAMTLAVLACNPADRAPGAAAGERDGSAAIGERDAANALNPADGAPAFSRPVTFGSACHSDAECGPGLQCLLSTGSELAPDLGEGPAGGLCTLACTSPVDCAFGANDATCASVSPGEPSYCLPTCTWGPGQSPEYKCLGRNDLACESSRTSLTGGLCVPTCGSSSGCDGRLCDLGSGLCGLKESAGAPLGADCSTGSGGCKNGFCLGFTDTVQACSGVCTLGAVGCGFDPESPEKLDAYCVLEGTKGSDNHDLGLCAQLCDCNDDCRSPHLICAPAPEGASLLMSVRGRRGACLPDDGVTPGIVCGGDGGTR